MDLSRRERDKNVAVVSSPERILRDGRRIFAASTAANPVQKPAFAPHMLRNALEEVPTPDLRAKLEGMFDTVPGRLLSEERPRLDRHAHRFRFFGRHGEYFA